MIETRAGIPYWKDFLAIVKEFRFAHVLKETSWVKHQNLMLKVISLELMKNVKPDL